MIGRKNTKFELTEEMAWDLALSGIKFLKYAEVEKKEGDTTHLRVRIKLLDKDGQWRKATLYCNMDSSEYENDEWEDVNKHVSSALSSCLAKLISQRSSIHVKRKIFELSPSKFGIEFLKKPK